MELLTWTEEGTRLVLEPSHYTAEDVEAAGVSLPVAKAYWDVGSDNVHIADVWWDGSNIDIRTEGAEHGYPANDDSVDETIERTVREDILELDEDDED